MHTTQTPREAAAVEAVGDAMFDAIERGGDIYAGFRAALARRGDDIAAADRAALLHRDISVVAAYGDYLERRDRGVFFVL